MVKRPSWPVVALTLLGVALLLAACRGAELDWPEVTDVATPASIPGTPTPAWPTPQPTPHATPTAPQVQQTAAPISAYLELRRSHATALTVHGPAPQRWNDPPPPEGVTEVTYPSGDLELRAWLAMPQGAQGDRTPAVVYFHGTFAFDMSELANVRPFLDAGLAVLMPALRGENGNPGLFELWYGEIDDARAAVRWLAAQPGIDAEHIYAFGHSVGGGVAALLSLCDDVPLRITASCGGLYPIGVFAAWDEIVPFDLEDQQEKRLRLLTGNMASMQRPHIAYLGKDEWLAIMAPIAEEEARACEAPLTVCLVEGDHYGAVAPAAASFIEAIRSDR